MSLHRPAHSTCAGTDPVSSRARSSSIVFMHTTYLVVRPNCRVAAATERPSASKPRAESASSTARARPDAGTGWRGGTPSTDRPTLCDRADVIEVRQPRRRRHRRDRRHAENPRHTPGARRGPGRYSAASVRADGRCQVDTGRQPPRAPRRTAFARSRAARSCTARRPAARELGSAWGKAAVGHAV
jgi:hypothetical protein